MWSPDHRLVKPCTEKSPDCCTFLFKQSEHVTDWPQIYCQCCFAGQSEDLSVYETRLARASAAFAWCFLLSILLVAYGFLPSPRVRNCAFLQMCDWNTLTNSNHAVKDKSAKQNNFQRKKKTRLRKQLTPPFFYIVF